MFTYMKNTNIKIQGNKKETGMNGMSSYHYYVFIQDLAHVITIVRKKLR